jgi:hypothetical protein
MNAMMKLPRRQFLHLAGAAERLLFQDPHHSPVTPAMNSRRLI